MSKLYKEIKDAIKTCGEEAKRHRVTWDELYPAVSHLIHHYMTTGSVVGMGMRKIFLSFEKPRVQHLIKRKFKLNVDRNPKPSTLCILKTMAEMLEAAPESRLYDVAWEIQPDIDCDDIYTLFLYYIENFQVARTLFKLKGKTVGRGIIL